jgi:hypothetical protein
MDLQALAQQQLPECLREIQAPKVQGATREAAQGLQRELVRVLEMVGQPAQGLRAEALQALGLRLETPVHKLLALGLRPETLALATLVGLLLALQALVVVAEMHPLVVGVQVDPLARQVGLVAAAVVAEVAVVVAPARAAPEMLVRLRPRGLMLQRAAMDLTELGLKTARLEMVK